MAFGFSSDGEEGSGQARQGTELSKELCPTISKTWQASNVPAVLQLTKRTHSQKHEKGIKLWNIKMNKSIPSCSMCGRLSVTKDESFFTCCTDES